MSRRGSQRGDAEGRRQRGVFWGVGKVAHSNVCVDFVLMRRQSGFRHARRDSLNTGSHNVSFRGFADYMQRPCSQDRDLTPLSIYLSIYL